MSENPAAEALDRDAIIALVRENPGVYGKREIARALKLDADQKLELKRLLREMEADGVIERRGRRGYAPPGAPPRVGVAEIIDRDADGELLARLVAAPPEAAPDIRIHAGDASGRGAGPALGVGDRALVRVSASPGDDGVFEARVIKRLGREGRRLLGVVRLEGARTLIEPVERASKSALAVRKEDAGGLADGQLVLCALEPERRYGLKTARVIEVVGDANSPKAATLIALSMHNIPLGFSAEEFAETEALAEAGPAGREDLTKLPLITIDPEDARDHDDAVWAEPDSDPNNPGGWVVIVAIADVAAYVRVGGALDRGAEMRGNSVYFPDRVVPMLPERLSTDLCSLREGEARPCLAVRMTLSAQGDRRSHAFLRGWMRSAAKLSYEQAQAAIDGKPDDKSGPLVTPVLKPLWGAYDALMAARARRAPLDIDAPERRIRLNEAGEIVEIAKRERFDAHKLIEAMMIEANVCAAESLERKGRPLVYRIHDAPAREKIDVLADFLPEVGLRWSKGEAATPARFNRLLMKAATTDHAEVVNEMVLRSQSQAVYSPENIGHFGLNLERYAHFTSPIRRYADLLVHRALIGALGLGEERLDQETAKRLPTIAERISVAERRAMAAERDATDRYLAGYLAARVGATFAGRITGVTRAGAFIRLSETGADGLAPVSLLGLERFHHDARAHALIGEETGGRYRLGMPVEAKLVEAAPITGGLIFEIETPPEPGPKPRGRRSGGRPSGHRRGPPKRRGGRR